MDSNASVEVGCNDHRVICYGENDHILQERMRVLHVETIGIKFNLMAQYTELNTDI
jgi:hypothetical protein